MQRNDHNDTDIKKSLNYLNKTGIEKRKRWDLKRFILVQKSIVKESESSISAD